MGETGRKKWLLPLAAVLLLGGLLLVIALKMQGRDRVIFLEDYRHYHKAVWKKGPLADDSEDFSFRLDYLYKGKAPDIAFVSFDNEAANECLKWVSEIVGPEGDYKGYRLGCKEFCFDFSSLEVGSVFEVNEITLSVDGKKKTIRTKGNIICEYLSDTDERYWSEALKVMPENGYNPDYLDSYGAGKLIFFNVGQGKIVLDRLEYRDYVTLPEVEVYIGALYQGTADEVFPLEVNSGETLVFRVGSMDFGEHGKAYEDMAFFDTDLLAYYHDRNGEEKILLAGQETMGPDFVPAIQRELTHQVLAEKGKVKTKTAVLAECMEVSATDGTGRKKVSVRMDVLCQGCDPHIAWKGFDNPEADKLLDSVSTETLFEDVDGRGTRVKRIVMNFQLGERNQEKIIEIGSVQLSVAGQEVTVDTAGRFSLAYEPYQYVYADNTRGNLSVSSSDEILTYVYRAREDGVLEDITLADERMRIVSARVILEKTNLGSPQEALPLSVKEGQELTVHASVSRGTAEPETGYLTNIMLHFSGEGGKHISRDLLEFLPDSAAYEEYLKQAAEKEWGGKRMRCGLNENERGL